MRVFFITTIFLCSLDDSVFSYFQLTNGAKVMSILKNIYSDFFLLFLVSTFSLVFKNKWILIRFAQHFIVCFLFF